MYLYSCCIYRQTVNSLGWFDGLQNRLNLDYRQRYILGFIHLYFQISVAFNVIYIQIQHERRLR